nr:hypothetical protein [uncultured Caproiciproducens sp.]
MSRQLVDNIIDQTKIMLFNMKITIHTCKMNDVVGEVPIWKRLYYTLHSLDQWFINPQEYVEPPFHETDLNSFDVPSKRVLTREELAIYYEGLQLKILQYLNQLTDDMLAERPEDCQFTRLALILGQYRHLMYHIGIINASTVMETGKQPKIIGMSADFPDEDHYYE